MEIVIPENDGVKPTSDNYVVPVQPEPETSTSSNKLSKHGDVLLSSFASLTVLFGVVLGTPCIGIPAGRVVRQGHEQTLQSKDVLFVVFKFLDFPSLLGVGAVSRRSVPVFYCKRTEC